MPPVRIRSLPRFVFVAVLSLGFFGLAPAFGQDLRETLESFDGTWKGEMKIHAIDGFLLRTVPVERQYFWDGDEQVVETRFADGGNEYVTRNRQRIQLGRLRATAERTGQPAEQYVGELREGGIAWTNTAGNSRDYTERILAKNGSRALEATSFEVVQLEGLSGLVRINLDLRPEGSAALVTVPTTADGQQLAALETVLAAARQELAEVAAKFEGAESALVESQARANRAEAEAAQFAAQVADLDRLRKELAAQLEKAGESTEGAASRATDATRALESVRFRLDAANAENVRLGERIRELEESAAGNEAVSPALAVDREALALAVKEAGERTATQELRIEELEQQLAAAREAGSAGEAVADASLEEIRRDLDAQQTLAGRLQQENVRLRERITELEDERGALRARVSTLDALLAGKPGAASRVPVSGPAPTVEDGLTFAQRSELIEEFDRLDRRLIDAESGRNTAVDKLAVVQSQLDEIRILRDDTLSRFQDVVSQLNAVRAERDRLTRANVSLEAELRALREEGSTGSVEEVEPGTLGGFLAAISGDEGTDSREGQAIRTAVARYAVVGVTKTDDEEKVLLDGRVYRKGDLVNEALGITFDRIDTDALVFTDREGREYRRSF